MEDRLANMRKKAQTGENDDKLADMLNEYGDLVKRVDEDLKAQREEELNSLEARLLQRRRDKRQAIADKAKQIEDGLNKEGVEDRSDLQERLNQVESLLQPVKQEEERLARITNDI
jgi:histidyl-tRNA synthetase